MANTADVLRAVGGCKPQIDVQTASQVVAIQHIGLATGAEQTFFQRKGQRRLAGAGQSREPEHAAEMAAAGLALRCGNAMFDGRDVNGWAHFDCFGKEPYEGRSSPSRSWSSQK